MTTNEPRQGLISEEGDRPRRPQSRKRLGLTLAAVLAALAVPVFLLFLLLREKPVQASDPETVKQKEILAQEAKRKKDSEKEIQNQPVLVREGQSSGLSPENFFKELDKAPPLAAPREHTPGTSSQELVNQLVESSDLVSSIPDLPRRRVSMPELGNLMPRLPVSRAPAVESHSEERGSMFAYSRTPPKPQTSAQNPELPSPSQDPPVTDERAGSVSQPLKVKDNTVPHKAMPAQGLNAASESLPPLIRYFSNLPPQTLSEGEFLEAVLRNSIRADTEPSPVVAALTRDVLDNSGQYVLLPANTIVIGVARAVNYKGANRLYIDFKRLILPNGVSVTLPSMPALDAGGSMGVVSKVDRHWMLQLGSGLFLGVVNGLGAAVQRSRDPYSGLGSVMGRTSQNFDAVLSRIMESYSNVMPTLSVPPGTPLKIFLSQDLSITPFARVHQRPYAREGS